MEDLYFNQTPNIELATNTFNNVPVILQYDETPLIEVVNEASAGFTTRFHVFHRDGTDLAVVKGSQLYLTKAGAKSGLTIEHPQLMTVCKLGRDVLFEIRRKEAASLHTEAEIYTPDGAFIRCKDKPLSVLFGADHQGLILGPQGGGLTVVESSSIAGCRTAIRIGTSHRAILSKSRITDCKIGIHVVSPRFEALSHN